MEVGLPLAQFPLLLELFRASFSPVRVMPALDRFVSRLLWPLAFKRYIFLMSVKD